MKRRFLQYAACRKCRAPFELRIERELGEEILEGSLVCRSCQASFPVTGGIPRFLPPHLSREKQATAAAFGYEWTHYAELTDKYLDEFLDWIKPVDASFFTDRLVLDAGCGKGRHAYLAAHFGARDVVGADLSEAVEAAFENTRQFPNVHIIQADLYSLPFLSPFDFVYSIGVLHHLPDPKLGFLCLVQHLKPGGRISLWVYGKEGNAWIEKLVNPIRIGVTSKLPKPLTRAISFLISLPLYAALKLVYRPVNRIPHLAPLRSKLLYGHYLLSISDFSFAENFWNVFDHLVAPTAFYHSRAEVEDWLATANLQQIEISARNNNSWRGTGVTNRTPA
jgi:SAM-dependent methyltransferase